MIFADERVLAAKRAAHEALIAEDPTTITVHRSGQMDDGAGGVMPIDEDLPPFVGRLLPESSTTRTRQTDVGPVEEQAWQLLAPADADISDAAGVNDEFDALGKRFRVVRVRPLRWKAQVYGYQVDCVAL